MADELLTKQAVLDLTYKGGSLEGLIHAFKVENLNGVNALVLPCKIGDTLYDITEFFEDYSHPDMYKLIVDYIEIRADCYGDIVFCIDGIDLKYEDFGKTVFLTREEAEKALEGREDNAN